MYQTEAYYNEHKGIFIYKYLKDIDYLCKPFVRETFTHSTVNNFQIFFIERKMGAPINGKTSIAAHNRLLIP